jgi:hypothetical protein
MCGTRGKDAVQISGRVDLHRLLLQAGGGIFDGFMVAQDQPLPGEIECSHQIRDQNLCVEELQARFVSVCNRLCMSVCKSACLRMSVCLGLGILG